MNSQPWTKPPRWWSPAISPTWVRLLRPIRLREQRVKQRLMGVETVGGEHLQAALDRGDGVLVTPNHASHADPFALYGAADAVGTPLYAMVAWQVFNKSGPLRKRALRLHGCFSIDREGTDVNAMRQARSVLQEAPYPLAIFPEGEVYHLNDRVTPFREGPAAIALMAAKKADRPILCIPCAMKFQYVEDPTPELLELMGRLEQALFWKPRPDLDLPERVYRFAEGLLALKEIEFFGQTSSGDLPGRVGALIEFLLARIEARYDVKSCGATVPERVKAARREIIRRLEEAPEGSDETRQLMHDLDDLFLVIQAFSYPGNHILEQPTVERIAETLDKFEEDVLGVKTATIRGARRARVVFGEPVPAAAERSGRTGVTRLTNELEQRVQALLDSQNA